MKRRRMIGAAVVMTVVFVALSGCEKEGPAERAGREADKAMADVGKQIEKAGESIQDAAKGEKQR